MLNIKDLDEVLNRSRSPAQHAHAKRKFYIRCDAIRWEQFVRRCRLDALTWAMMKNAVKDKYMKSKYFGNFIM